MKQREILIYSERASFPGGKAYLCADGSLTSEREQAQAHWECQLDALVAENWILTISGPARIEYTGNTL